MSVVSNLINRYFNDSMHLMIVDDVTIHSILNAMMIKSLMMGENNIGILYVSVCLGLGTYIM